MPQVTLLWFLWLRLLQPFAGAFTCPGHRRFVEWITALALNVEEHTVTQSVTAIERMADWRAMERCRRVRAVGCRRRHPQPRPLDRAGPRPPLVWLPRLGRR